MLLLVVRVSEKVCLIGDLQIEDSVINVGGARSKEIEQREFLHIPCQARVEAPLVVVVSPCRALGEVPLVEADQDEEGERLFVVSRTQHSHGRVLTVNLMRNTLAECNLRGDTTKLSGHKTARARRLNGGW